MMLHTPVTPAGRRRMLAATAVVVAASFGLVGCSGSGGGSSSSGSVTLKETDYQTDAVSAKQITDLLHSCAKEVGGVTIDRTAIPQQNLVPQLLQQAQAHALPDLVRVDNPDVKSLIATGAFVPLNQFGLSGAGQAPGMVAAASSGGKIYGLAPAANTVGLYYNKTLFKDAGIANPPATWDELKADAKKLTSGSHYGLALSAPSNAEGTWTFMPFMWSNGGDETDLTSPQVAGALHLYSDLISDGSMSKGVLNWTQQDVADQFTAGKAAMMVNGSWQRSNIASSKIDWGQVQIPVPQAGDTSVAPLGGEEWVLPQTGDKTKQAKAAAMIKCITEPKREIALASTSATVPVRASAVGPFLKQVPSMAAFAKQVQNGRSRTAKLGAKWNDASTQIANAIQLVLTGKASPDTAMKQASQQ